MRTHAADRPGAAALAVDSAGRPEPVAAAGRGAEEAWLDELGALWARMPGKDGQASPELLQALKTVAKLALHPAPEQGAASALELPDTVEENAELLEMLVAASHEARGILKGLYLSSQGNAQLIKAIKAIAKFVLEKMGLCGEETPDGLKGMIAGIVCKLVAEPGAEEIVHPEAPDETPEEEIEAASGGYRHMTRDEEDEAAHIAGAMTRDEAAESQHPPTEADKSAEFQHPPTE